MKAYALVPALEGRVARMAKLADPPDLGFRNRRFHNVPLRSTDRRFTGEKRDFSIIRAALTTDLIGRSGTGACRVTAFAIELFDCQFQKRFRQATDS
jgi:hypothetical protein